jgi:hypothetical protein
MKATELRLGNLINLGGNMLNTYQTYKPVVVTIPLLKAISEENEERPDAVMSVYQPIELTEEWLLKFGFEKYEWCEKCAFIKFHGKHLMIRYYRDEWHVTETTVCKDIHGHYTKGHKEIIPSSLLKYVHQLQNFYFALTGEELTIVK